ncbi:MAG: thioredoxin domain-containing protein [Rikenellaceae bacterium]|nr:thioredoxin domain-containing protein [Rikenellaceae bacterium]
MDGLIVVPVTVNGAEYPFILDLSASASTAVRWDCAQRMGFTAAEENRDHPRPEVTALAYGSVTRLGVDNRLFLPVKKVFAVQGDLLEQTGAAGILGADVFPEQVLSIDRRNRSIVVSAPYKPGYIPLRNRTELIGFNGLTVQIDGADFRARIDLWEPRLVTTAEEMPAFETGNLTFACQELSRVSLPTITSGQDVVLGSELLDSGMLSLDFGRQKIYFEPYRTLNKPAAVLQPEHPVSREPVLALDLNTFITQIFDHRQSQQWNYLSARPALIDFWAVWCGPCKQLSPLVEQLAEEYAGRVDFYKLDVDQEKEIARYFQAHTLPLLLYIPMQGDPIPVHGLRSIEQLRHQIETLLLDPE